MLMLLLFLRLFLLSSSSLRPRQDSSGLGDAWLAEPAFVIKKNKSRAKEKLNKNAATKWTWQWVHPGVLFAV